MAKTDRPRLNVREIADLYTRKNFENLAAYFAEQNQLLDFRFVEIDTAVAVTRERIKHNLNLVPRDLIRLEVSGPGKITLHKGVFDSTYLYYSSDGAVHARLFVGLSRASTPVVLAEDAVEVWEAVTPELEESRQEFSGEGLQIADLSRTPSKLKLFVAGKLLRVSQYTLTGTRIVLTTPLAMGEFLEAIYF